MVGLLSLLLPAPSLAVAGRRWPSLAGDDRPGSLAEAGGNPLALSAQAFLEWYWLVFFILAAIAGFVRLFGKARLTAPGQPGEIASDPYLMAYLAGGKDRVVATVLASLVQQGALRVNPITRELIAESDVPEDRPKIELRARGLFLGSRPVTDKARFQRWMQRELALSLKLIQERLRRFGLLARPRLQAMAVTPLTVVFVLLHGVGLVRTLAGIGAGRPVGFLLISMVATLLAAWWLLRGMGTERPTPEGYGLLKESRARLGQGDDDRLWTVSLLGLSGYGMGAMADLHFVTQKLPKELLSWGQGRKKKDGGCSGGGGCGGGGCGGGGCGGGGCGG